MTHECPACGGLADLTETDDAVCRACDWRGHWWLSANAQALVLSEGNLGRLCYEHNRLKCQVCYPQETPAPPPPREYSDNPIPWRGP